MLPILYYVIPCYNEETVLPTTSLMFEEEILSLIKKKKISKKSKILFVNDGSSDSTWQIISELISNNSVYCGISLSRNMGHQNALLAGLMQAKETSDITISIDCDGQDDISVSEKMVDLYREGYEIVYGVRSKRDSDTLFKKYTAELYYRMMIAMGAELKFNHADYRLVSSKVLKEFEGFKEVNLFLRGLFPLVGFNSTTVEYERSERIAGSSHYNFKKMLALAINGITSLSIKPIRIITCFGMFVALLSFFILLWSFIGKLRGSDVVDGWTSTTCIICLVSGIQLISLGIIGEYVGKIYLETKSRPRFIIREKKNI